MIDALPYSSLVPFFIVTIKVNYMRIPYYTHLLSIKLYRYIYFLWYGDSYWEISKI